MAFVSLEGLARFWANIKQRLEGSANADLANVSAAAFAQKMREAELEAIYTAESTDGVAYTVTVPGVTELKHGMRIWIIPSRNSSSTTPTLNVNGLGAHGMRLPLSFNNVASTMPKLATYFSAGKPMMLWYDESYAHGQWKVFGKNRTSAQDLYGTVPIEGGGTGATTAEAALEALGAVSQLEYDEKIAALEARIAALEGN